MIDYAASRPSFSCAPGRTSRDDAMASQCTISTLALRHSRPGRASSEVGHVRDSLVAEVFKHWRPRSGPYRVERSGLPLFGCDPDDVAVPASLAGGAHLFFADAE